MWHLALVLSKHVVKKKKKNERNFLISPTWNFFPFNGNFKLGKSQKMQRVNLDYMGLIYMGVFFSQINPILCFKNKYLRCSKQLNTFQTVQRNHSFFFQFLTCLLPIFFSHMYHHFWVSCLLKVFQNINRFQWIPSQVWIINTKMLCELCLLNHHRKPS